MLPLAGNLAPFLDLIGIVQVGDACSELAWRLNVIRRLLLRDTGTHGFERSGEFLAVVFALECGDLTIGRHELIDTVERLVALLDPSEDGVFDELIEVFLCSFHRDLRFVGDPRGSTGRSERTRGGANPFPPGYRSPAMVVIAIGVVGQTRDHGLLEHISTALKIWIDLMSRIPCFQLLEPNPSHSLILIYQA